MSEEGMTVYQTMQIERRLAVSDRPSNFQTGTKRNFFSHFRQKLAVLHLGIVAKITFDTIQMLWDYIFITLKKQNSRICFTLQEELAPFS